MSDFIMSLPAKGQYYFDKIDYSRVNVTFTKREYGGFINFLRRINVTLIKHNLIPIFVKKLSRRVYDERIINAIVNDTGLAIVDTYVNYDILYLIRKYKPKKTYLLVWNPLTDEAANMYKKYIDLEHIYSYSIDECKKYGFNHFNDFYLMDYPYEKKDNVRDFYFLGRDKDRMELMENFLKLVGSKYSYQFDIYTEFLDDKKKGNKLFNYFSEYIPFTEYLNRVFESRCLIDFNTTTNITFRTLESLIFKKKYISNNKMMKNMEFYNPNNILIVDENTTIEDIDRFLELPYINIDNEILNQYDFYHTYELFKKKCEEVK